MIVRRLLIVAACLLAADRIAASAGSEEVRPREPLVAFPSVIGQWRSVGGVELDALTIARLGVDEYINRGYASGPAMLGLYVGYYATQRQGDSMHSPLNCLPGAGWQPLSREYVEVPLADGRALTVNRYVIQKGLDRQVVIYWYQSHGRVVANEYASKVYMVYDALRLHRTDAAMIRITSPIDAGAAGAESVASERAIDFMRAMFPALAVHLP